MAGNDREGIRMHVTARSVALYGGILFIGLAGPYLFPAFKIQMADLWLFIVFALTWDMLGGRMGYNSFGNVFFLGVGMYACVVTQVALFHRVSEYTAARGGSAEFEFTAAEWLIGLFAGLPLGAVLAVVGAVVLGAFILGMRGQYFAICTLGLGIAAGELAAAWDWIGAGSGITTPLPPDTLGDVNVLLYYLAFGLAVVVFLFFRWLHSTRFGLAVNAIRDDEDKAEAMGLRTTRIKVTAWAISAFFLGIAGGIMGNLKKFIDPIAVAFSGITYGVWMVVMAILGGKGTLWGPVIGAVVFQVMKELFWTYLLGWQRVALGLLIVVIVVFFPTGIVGTLRERFPERFGYRIDEDTGADAASARAGSER